MYKNDIGVEAAGFGPKFFYLCLELGGGEVEELPEVLAEVGLVGIAGLVGQCGEGDIGIVLNEFAGVVEAEDAGEEFGGEADVLKKVPFEGAGVDVELFCEVGDLLAAVLGLEGGCDGGELGQIGGGWGEVGQEIAGEEVEFYFAGLVLELFDEGVDRWRQGLCDGEDIVDEVGCFLGGEGGEAPGVEAGGDEAGDAIGEEEEFFCLGADEEVFGEGVFAGVGCV